MTTMPQCRTTSDVARRLEVCPKIVDVPTPTTPPRSAAQAQRRKRVSRDDGTEASAREMSATDSADAHTFVRSSLRLLRCSPGGGGG
jgi:hypothetical protein